MKVHANAVLGPAARIALCDLIEEGESLGSGFSSADFNLLGARGFRGSIEHSGPRRCPRGRLASPG